MIKLPAIVLGLMLLLAGTTQKVMAQNEDVSLQSFYDELSPYGTWIQDPQYGYVWRPDVDQDEFRPYYTNGRWVMTEYGNTWVSNYDWGWAPFHYGRWVYNRYNNWIWIPDTVWGPAWVSWRSGGGYYGWAPLGPSISIGINIGRGGYRIPDMCWNFVPYRSIYYNSYPRYYGSRNRIYIQNTVIINNTYVRNNRTYYTGPRAEEVRRVTNQNVTVYNVNRSNRPGASRIENNTVNIYNPRPSRGDNANAAPRNAVRGSINRGEVVTGRNNSVGNNSNVDRYGNRSDNGAVSNRPSRGEATMPTRDNNNRVGVAPPASGNPEVNGRGGYDRNGNSNQPSRTERMERPQQQIPERVERMERPQREETRQMPQRIERPQQQAPERVERMERPQQQRTERPQPVQQAQPRMERPQQQAPQRMERAEPQRVERTQSAPQRSSGGGSENRGGRGEGGSGRPGRG